MKKNCWETKKCGREPGGIKAKDLGVCPAASEERLDGVHEGRNAGRACWVVAGTYCGGQAQGTFAQKITSCMECEFFKSVKEEEGAHYEMAIVLLNRINAFVRR